MPSPSDPWISPGDLWIRRVFFPAWFAQALTAFAVPALWLIADPLIEDLVPYPFLKCFIWHTPHTRDGILNEFHLFVLYSFIEPLPY
jgi:hypothetical protein